MAGAEAAVAPMYAVPLGLAELAVGDVAAARRRADLAARGVAATSGPWTRGRVLALQARVALAEGDATAAQALAQDALAGHRDGGDKLSVCDSLELLAGAIASEGRYDVAARLLGAAESIRTSVGYARFVVDQPSWDATLASCRDSLDAEALATAWRDGAALSIDDIVAFATRGRGPRRRPTTGWGSLTPTESEVAELVAEGLSNRDIAQRLFVSPRTIQTHLTHIYAKLQIDSRVKLATSARDLHREGGTSPAPRSYTSNQ
jgi:DNA-binding CsgD family transcriptional regulator